MGEQAFEIAAAHRCELAAGERGGSHLCDGEEVVQDARMHLEARLVEGICMRGREGEKFVSMRQDEGRADAEPVPQPPAPHPLVLQRSPG
jgi:hypothetical protein